MSRSVGVLGTLLPLLMALATLVAVSKRTHRARLTGGAGTALVAAAEATLNAPVAGEEGSPIRRVPRLVLGTLIGVVAGVALGIAAVLALSIAGAGVRSVVIVGAGQQAASVSGGQFVARVMAQAMNPTLAYADDEDVAALLTRSDDPPEQSVIAPVEQKMRDSAALVFVVLGALTIVTWSLLMWGLSGRRPAARAVVE